MASLHTVRIVVAIAVYLPLIAMMSIGESTAREVRPSEHGLEYQSLPPTGLKSPQMMSFFGVGDTPSSSSSTPSTVSLPKATNSNETAWWGSHRRSDRVRHVLLLGSLVCGVTGVALLAASAFIYLFRSRIRSSSHSSSTSTAIANNSNANTITDNNSLVLVTK